MSSISSKLAPAPIKLIPSRWPLYIWLSGLAVALASVALSGLALIWQLLAIITLLAIGMSEWRRQRQLNSILFSSQTICATLSSGQTLEATWPLPGMAGRYWVSLGFPASPARRIWLTIYSDQLPADDFRRLCVMMRR